MEVTGIRRQSGYPPKCAGILTVREPTEDLSGAAVNAHVCERREETAGDDGNIWQTRPRRAGEDFRRVSDQCKTVCGHHQVSRRRL